MACFFEDAVTPFFKRKKKLIITVLPNGLLNNAENAIFFLA